MYRLNAAQPFIKGFQVTCAVGVPGCSLDIACNDTSLLLVAVTRTCSVTDSKPDVSANYSHWISSVTTHLYYW